MTKQKQVTIKMNVHAAAAVRQILYEAQKGYTTDANSMPLRIFEIREVIADLDDAIEKIIKE